MGSNETVTLNLTSMLYRKKKFAAGVCNVILFGLNVPGIACVAGNEKTITSEVDAKAWLCARGLSVPKASKLIDVAKGKAVDSVL